MTITRDEISRVLGPVDDALAAEIAASGASASELAEAWAWINSDEALVNGGRPLPGPRIADLIELLSPDDADDR